MELDAEVYLVPLSREEALEVFSRCLQCQEADTEHSASALKKLAQILAAESCPGQARVAR